jgi:hypothetical protein
MIVNIDIIMYAQKLYTSWSFSFDEEFGDAAAEDKEANVR